MLNGVMCIMYAYKMPATQSSYTSVWEGEIQTFVNLLSVEHHNVNVQKIRTMLGE